MMKAKIISLADELARRESSYLYNQQNQDTQNEYNKPSISINNNQNHDNNDNNPPIEPIDKPIKFNRDEMLDEYCIKGSDHMELIPLLGDENDCFGTLQPRNSINYIRQIVLSQHILSHPNATTFLKCAGNVYIVTINVNEDVLLQQHELKSRSFFSSQEVNDWQNLCKKYKAPKGISIAIPIGYIFIFQFEPNDLDTLSMTMHKALEYYSIEWIETFYKERNFAELMLYKLKKLKGEYRSIIIYREPLDENYWIHIENKNGRISKEIVAYIDKRLEEEDKKLDIYSFTDTIRYLLGEFQEVFHTKWSWKLNKILYITLLGIYTEEEEKTDDV